MRYGGIEDKLTSLLESSVKAVLQNRAAPLHSDSAVKIELEIPREKSNGDVSTNIAMKAAKLAKKPPLQLAEILKTDLEKRLSRDDVLNKAVASVEMKKPGFINFFLSDGYLLSVLAEIRNKDLDFGRSDMGRGDMFQVEFVSANPTGPLTIAHGRQAAIGDSLSNILEFLGYKVTREYYLNDEGTQMNILGMSIRARYLELCGAVEEFPADGYKGSYVKDIAADFKNKHGERFVRTKNVEEFRQFGLEWILGDIKRDLHDFGVKFDVWYSQKALAASGKVQETLSFLREKGYVYEKDGAAWFNSRKFGDDKDRVLIKSDGNMTYLAPDIAYHRDKYARGFKRIADIWGPDHHGYVPRMKAAINALGFSDDSLSVLIVQLATLYRNGQVVSMSTRAGEFVTLREVMDAAGKDVARFVFLSRRLSSHLDFDLDVIKKESAENPVYYIQYAHARIWSILEYAGEKSERREFDASLLKEAEELAIIRMLWQFPMVVSASGRICEPYIVLQYLQELATSFHCFYTKHRVVNDNLPLTQARLALVDCIRIVLANGLKLLGVSLPKKM